MKRTEEETGSGRLSRKWREKNIRDLEKLEPYQEIEMTFH